ncbi:MerR family DNA-binding transcriptional regulator [Mesorhizobium sp. B3-2-1]|nr:MerR family DNA-binding transcriptional regulator [Mesorhizobium sp. B3-2-1]
MSGHSTPLGDNSRAPVPVFPTNLVSIEELAAMLGVSVRTIRRYQAAGLTPSRIRRSRQLLYKHADAEAWVVSTAAHRKISRTAPPTGGCAND